MKEILIAIAVSLLVEEVLGLTDSVSRWIARVAARSLPPELRKRLEVEWIETLATRPKLSRLIFAIDLFRAAYVIEHESRLPNVRASSAVAVRAVDMVVAGFMLMVAAPILLIVYSAIRLEGGWRYPALYRVRRIGMLGKQFEILKFRTIYVDESSVERGRRITHVGSLVRLTRLDELPQLLNVLRGDMSFVGPRPERPDEKTNQLLESVPSYRQRLLVRPGITGPAQIDAASRFNRVAQEEKSLALDLTCVDQHGPRLWFKTMWQTLVFVLLGPR